MVCFNPISKSIIGVQFKSLFIREESIAYLKSCPGLSSTNSIRDLLFFDFLEILSISSQIILTISILVISLWPPIQ